MFIFFTLLGPGGAVILIEGGAWREVHSSLAPRAGTLHVAPMVPTPLEERNRELQMDSVSAKVAILKDSDRKNALKP